MSTKSFININEFLAKLDEPSLIDLNLIKRISEEMNSVNLDVSKNEFFQDENKDFSESLKKINLYEITKFKQMENLNY